MSTSRRQLLIGTAALGGALALPRIALAATPTPFRISLWLRLNRKRTKQEWQEYFALLKRAGVHSIYPQVYPNSHARYQSKVLPVRRPILETIIPLALAEGLEVHAWMHTMLCNVESVRDTHPEWFALSASGKRTSDQPPYTSHYRFLCPTRPAVCRFLLSIVDELCAIQGLSGVHLDFVRHPDVFLPAKFSRRRGLVDQLQGLGVTQYSQMKVNVSPDTDFCYCDVCQDVFSQSTGFTLKEPRAPEVEQAWATFRLDRMSRLVGALAARTKASQKKISAAVFPTPALSRHIVRQAWDEWPLDAAMPMIYHKNYEKPLSWIQEATGQASKEVAGRFPIYTGILLSSLPTSQTVAAIEFARKGGAAGVMLFNTKEQDLKVLERKRVAGHRFQRLQPGS